MKNPRKEITLIMWFPESVLTFSTSAVSFQKLKNSHICDKYVANFVGIFFVLLFPKFHFHYLLCHLIPSNKPNPDIITSQEQAFVMMKY